MPRLKPRQLDRSVSEPSGSLRERMLADNSGHDSATKASSSKPFSQPEFYQNFLAGQSLHEKHDDDRDLEQWRRINQLNSDKLLGSFSGKRQEEFYVVYQSAFTDTSTRAFLVLFFVVFVASILTEFRRIDTIFDVGPKIRSVRLTMDFFMLSLIIYLGIRRHLDPDYFIHWRESRRLMIARLFTYFWFLYFPTVHAPLLGFSPPKGLSYDTFVIWTLLLLNLSSLCSCAALKLRFRYSAEIVLTAGSMTMTCFLMTETRFNWRDIYSMLIILAVLVFNLVILRRHDSRARMRFVRAAHQFEVARRVTEMAKRLRAAQAFASASWKSDNTVMALRRIREDPVLADEYAHQMVLEIGISTIAHSRETPSNVSDVWPTSRNWSHSLPQPETSKAVQVSPQTPKTKAQQMHHQLLSKLLDWSPNKVELPPTSLGLLGEDGPSGHSPRSHTAKSVPTHYRRASSLTETEGRLESDLLEPLMSDWNFGSSRGIWSHMKDSRLSLFCTRPLVSTMLTALDAYGFFDPGLPLVEDGVAVDGPFLNKSSVLRYFAAVEAAYNPRDEVPYHNVLHAVDVVQTVYAMTKLDMEALRDMPRLALFALLFGAAVHDVGHPGVNNAHLVACGHDLAIKYNDRSVLENFHVSRAFDIMFSSDLGQNNILRDFEERDRKCGTQRARVFRNLVVEMVLATDLSHHFDCQARFRAKLDGRVDFADVNDTSLVCSVLLHAADVGNVAKSWPAYEPWIELLFAEFYAQGDKEKKMGLSVAPFMDRDVSVPEKAQSAFISNIVLPLYQVMSDFTPNTARHALENMAQNLSMLDRKAREREASQRASPAGSLETIVSHVDDADGLEESGSGRASLDDEN